MPLPKTAVLLEKLQQYSPPATTCSSANKILYKQFEDFDSSKKFGYYKALDENYTPFAAKLAVASSVLLRLVLENPRAADVRIVYNTAKQICGTISINEGFIPFSQAKEKKFSNPNAQQIIDFDAAAILVQGLILDNNDMHRNNFGLVAVNAAQKCGVIDFGEVFNFINQAAQGRDKKIPANISFDDFENFPLLTQWLPRHWVTYKIPANNNFLKMYPNHKEYLKLSPQTNGSEALKLVFSQQKYFEFLKNFIISRNKDLVLKMLHLSLGDEPLSYLDLSEQLLEKKLPDFFNSTTNNKPFYETFARLYLVRVKTFEKTLLSYLGCHDKALKQPSFNNFLVANTSIRNKLARWLELKNLDYPKDLQIKNFPELYHDIWRCSFKAGIGEIYQEIYVVVTKLLKNLYARDNTKNFIPNNKNIVDRTYVAILKSLRNFKYQYDVYYECDLKKSDLAANNN